MATVFTDIVQAVVDSINGETFTPTVTAQRVFTAEVELKNMTTAPVLFARLSALNPVQTSTGSGTRGGRFADVPIELLLAAKGDAGDLTLADQMIDLAQQIDSHLFGDRVLTAGAYQAQWLESSIAALFTDDLRDNGISSVELNVTYRVFLT